MSHQIRIKELEEKLEKIGRVEDDLDKSDKRMKVAVENVRNEIQEEIDSLTEFDKTLVRRADKRKPTVI